MTAIDAPWMRKLRGRSAHELWTRGRQLVSASAERLHHGGREEPPAKRAFAALLTPEFARRQDAVEALLIRFRARDGARFFDSFNDLAATAVAASSLNPTETRTIVAKADAIRSGRFDLLGYRALSFGDPIDWQLDPVAGVRSPLIHWSRIPYLDTSVVGDHKVVWELNRHQYFLTLGQAAALTGDDRYLRTCVEHLERWMDANPPKLGVNWCSSLEIAFRSMSWLWALHFLRDSDLLTPALYERILAHLYLNAKHLESYLSTYFSPNTHLTGEALGLVFIGTLLPEFRDAARWRELGWSTFERTLTKQVYPDGVYFEQASHYQRYTSDFVIHAILLDDANGNGQRRALRGLLEKLLVHLVHLRRPDGSTPLIGDDDGGRLAPLDTRPIDDHGGVISTGALVLSHPSFACQAPLATETIWLLGPAAVERFAAIAEGDANSPSMLFADGGYGIMRDDWSGKSGHMVMDCGPHGAMSGAHAHADALAIQVSAGGRAVLVDAGTYTYGQPAERDAFRGAFAHNVAILDETPPSVPAGAFAWRHTAQSRVCSWHSCQSFDFLEASHDGYREMDPAVEVRRAVLGLRHRYWVVRDRAWNGSDHSLQLHFHAAPGIEMAPEGHRLHLGRNTNGYLCISSFGTPRAATPSYSTRGSWTSTCYGERSASWHGILRCEHAAAHDVVSFLVPGPDQVDVTEIEVDRGRLFKLSSTTHCDLMAFGGDSPVRREGFNLAGTAAWLRWNRREDRLEEVVLVEATQLTLNGIELLRDGQVVPQLSAKIVDGAWIVVASGLAPERWTATPNCGRPV